MESSGCSSHSGEGFQVVESVDEILYDCSNPECPVGPQNADGFYTRSGGVRRKRCKTCTQKSLKKEAPIDAVIREVIREVIEERINKMGVK